LDVGSIGIVGQQILERDSTQFGDQRHPQF
jgi:hypothetical protein